MITRVNVGMRVNQLTADWIARESRDNNMSVSGFITHKLLDCINADKKTLIKTSRKIKNYARVSATIPIDVMTKVYDLSKTHNTSASKLVAAELMLACEREFIAPLMPPKQEEPVKSRDEMAGMALTIALCEFSKMTGDQPQDVDGWEGMLWHILNEMREAKRNYEANNG